MLRLKVMAQPILYTM